MTAQGYKYLSPPSARTVGILLFTQRISTSLSRIAIHKGLSARWDSTRASRTYSVIFVSGALCGLIVEFAVFHYIVISTGINTICFKSDSCLYPPLAKQLLYKALPSPRAVIVKIAARYYTFPLHINVKYEYKGESWLKALWLNFFLKHQTLKPAAVTTPRGDSICLFDPNLISMCKKQ